LGVAVAQVNMYDSATLVDGDSVQIVPVDARGH
jgi:hypothetical protein